MIKKILVISFATTVAFSFDFGSLISNTMDKVKEVKSSTSSSTTSLSNDTVSSGLKEALKIGVNYGVKELSRDGGYLNNSEVKIPLPKSLDSAQSVIRKAGGGKILDDLVVSMNKAATQAAPKTASIFLDAVNKISIDDAKTILAGNDDAATAYFKEHTTKPLIELIKPIINQSMEDNKVASYYDTAKSFYKSNLKGYVQNSSLMKLANNYGADKYLPTSDDANLDEYVTKNAINGLFTMIAKKEQSIRKNPMAQTTTLLKQVFGK